jgi:hypothetical protein
MNEQTSTSAANLLAVRGILICREAMIEAGRPQTFTSSQIRLLEGLDCLVKADANYVSEIGTSNEYDALKTKLHLAYWFSWYQIDTKSSRKFANEAKWLAVMLGEPRRKYQAILIARFGWRAAGLVGPLP